MATATGVHDPSCTHVIKSAEDRAGLLETAVRATGSRERSARREKDRVSGFGHLPVEVEVHAAGPHIAVPAGAGAAA